MRVVVVGGSASNVGKTTLAMHLLRREGTPAKVALKVSVRERPCETRVLVLGPGDAAEHRRDSSRLLDAGATHVVWVTVQRPNVRAGLAAGLRAVRALGAQTVVIESTSAGIHLNGSTESWFVAGEGAWKPWAHRHQERAGYVVTSADVRRLIEEPALLAV